MICVVDDWVLDDEIVPSVKIDFGLFVNFVTDMDVGITCKDAAR